MSISEGYQSGRPFLEGALRLHHYLRDHFWRDGMLTGPDSGVRFNLRAGRFIKGYLSLIPWKDDLYYLQGQGYWVNANWWLAESSGLQEYADIAIQTSDRMLERQRFDGAWDYPNPEWRGRVATVEGTWGALGLLTSYRKTGDSRYLDAILRWHRYMLDEIGFQRDGEQLAVNYFGHEGGSRVPNNSTLALAFLAELAKVTGNEAYLEPCRDMVAFVTSAQMLTGELAYSVKGMHDGRDRPHYQCYQYNAFQCMDLVEYWQLTGDVAVRALIERNARFLAGGLGRDGRAFYSCDDRHHSVTYHAAALGAAFARVTQAGIDDYRPQASRAFGYVLNRQRQDGSFPHSQGDYRILSDQRSYPRNLAMICYHLLTADSALTGETGAVGGVQSANLVGMNSEREQPA